jgi:hypothetical protein
MVLKRIRGVKEDRKRFVWVVCVSGGRGKHLNFAAKQLH